MSRLPQLPPRSRPTARASRRPWAVVGVATTVMLLVGLGTWFSRRTFEEEPSVHLATPASGAAAGGRGPIIKPVAVNQPFQVAAAEGRLEAFRNGRWTAMAVGDALSAQDVVRTSPGGRAVLRRAGAEIELREKVDVRLDQFTSEAASLDVLRGKVVANVSGSGESVEIKARETKSVNEGLARFVVSVDDRGRVSVASTAGTTRFAASGKEVVLKEGTESHADPGKPPAEPEKIPEDVLLSVVWPEGARREDRTQVKGQVRPSSAVKINGVDAPVAPDGRFVATVPLREGGNRVEVEAEDLSGKMKNLTNTVVRRSKGPGLQAEPTELWKQ